MSRVLLLFHSYKNGFSVTTVKFCGGGGGRGGGGGGGGDNEYGEGYFSVVNEGCLEVCLAPAV